MEQITWHTIWEKKYEKCSSEDAHIVSGFDTLTKEKYKYLVNYFFSIECVGL